jgi:type VI protein secretion system component Hcp
MSRWTTARIVVVSALAAGSLGVGMTLALSAGASGSSTTYYACLKSGKLSAVGTVAPTCGGTATQISWDAQGPAGAPGAQGPVGQASVVDVSPQSLFAGACPEPPGAQSSDGSGTSAYLDIPSIPGESTDPGHTGQIDVDSWSMGIVGSGVGAACSATRSSSGGGSGVEQFSVVTPVDKSTPTLMADAAAGTNLGTITLAVTKTLSGGSEGEYLDYTFQNAVTSSVQWLGAGGDRPEVQSTFAYSALTVSYRPEDSNGILGTPILACFDAVLQRSC